MLPRLLAQVAGIPAEDFVYVSFANAALGATPYIIALHRWAGGAGTCLHRQHVQRQAAAAYAKPAACT